ncbi:MAG: Mur ligase domain-containing protein, partial [Bacteroidales bacterium]|nr:Mur ligase domain-containing protein [Bacteroidales bacterium]
MKVELNNIENFYFLGIGGIGMSALARYFKTIGKNVAGYDRTETSLTNSMQDIGMPIHFKDDVKLIPGKYLDKDTTVVIRTPAVPD